MFRSFFDKVHPKFYTDVGSPVKDEFQLRVVDETLDIVKTGQSNLYEYIQSHADSVDIHKILERCAQVEDYSILQRMPSDFMDVTQAPSNLAEAYQAVKDSENYFAQLPKEIRSEFNNNFVDFIHNLGTSKFDSVVGSYLDSLNAGSVDSNVDTNVSAGGDISES
uniref:Internal scaffolding protein n=1 Tax=Dulem virus 169 TaxID=3145646 RepID=A0AAU8AWB9_9VIRU